MKHNDELTRLFEFVGEPIARNLESTLVPQRIGSVLAHSTILKCEFMPLETENILQFFKFQKIKNYPVF